jgi:hypothetical protein
MSYWKIMSRVDPKSIRIIQAKNRNGVKAHVYADAWLEPEKATVDDVAQAAVAGVKPETASD